MTDSDLTKEIIENHLQSLFTPQIRMRGLELFGEGAVQEAFIDEKTGIIHGMVRSSNGGAAYNQVLNINPKNRFLSSAQCSCPYKNNCKHSAAILHHVIHQDVDVIDTESKEETLSKGSDIVRYLPADMKLTDALEKYSYSNNPYYVNNRTIKFLPDNTLKVLCYEKTPYYLGNEEKEIADVLFFRKNGALGLKCNTCSAATQRLCKHQKAALEQLILEVDYEKYLSEDLNYGGEMKAFAHQMKVDETTLSQSYELRIKHKRIYLHKINNALLEKEDIDNITTKILSYKKPLDDNRINSLESEDISGNALVWTTDFNEQAIFHLIKGRLNKSKDKLTAKLENTDYPSYLIEYQLNTYKQLDVLQKNIDLKVLDTYDRVKLFIQDEIDNLNEVIHFVDTDNFFPELNKSSLKYFTFSNKTARLQFEVDVHPIGYTLISNIFIENRPLEETERNAATVTPLFIYSNGQAFLFDKPSDYILAKEFLRLGNLYFNKQDREELNVLIDNISNYTDITWSNQMELNSKKLINGNKEIYLKEVGEFILIEPFLVFDDIKFNILNERDKLLGNSRYTIDEEEREEFLSVIKQLHPNFNINFFFQDYLYLKMQQVLDDLWFLEFYDKCRENEIEVFGQEKLKKLNFSPHRGVVSNYIKSGIDWFDVEVDMQFGDQVVNIMDWVKAIKDDQKYVKLDDGTLGMIPEEWISRLKRIVQSAEISKDGIKISKFKFNVIDELFENIDDNAILEELREKKEKLMNYDYRSQFDLPSEITADMRPYQKSGYQWLRTLDEIQWGGILADDMGLGKTLQIISLLTDVHKTSERCSLIVVPRSLVFNWVNELEKFSPDLKYLIHYGLDRTVSREKFYEYDLIITTYTLVANDIRELKDIHFEYIILDESQAIKNVMSQRYRSVSLLKANNRFCMTGTPIENNTFELYAQMNFVNPGMLGSQKSFKDLYAQPIDADGDEDASTLLKKIIHPFILRRTKEIVAKDLPEKTETVVYCEMGKQQRKIYDQLKAQIRQDLTGKIEQDGLNKSKMKILEGLLRLRQICNSPALVNSDLPKSQQESIKIETLMEQLTEELNDHNALVFSQFTSMLKLIREELDKRGVKYSYLDGSTTKRKEAVEEFDNNDDIKIFLISLKAGNTGLNLVKADYVYIVDPWWNPAVEAQAIDRTHRIGQDKNIFAYKLVCKDTIEEKILKLQEKKKKIAADIISTDENIIKSMNKEELLALFD